jgi:2'-5' RNA ligase
MRIFIGIDLPENIKENLKEIIEKVKKIKEAKLVKIENLHITLKFLGEVEEEKIEVINRTLQHCADKSKSFNVKIKGIGVFPSEKKVRVLWAGIEDGEDLKNLNRKIEDALKNLGFEKEKEFVAHITIARFKSIPNLNFIKELITKYQDILFGEILVKNFQLYESKLTPLGPIYKVIKKYEFI